MSRKGYDVAVIGAGILGLAHAYAAARAGKRVVVIERDPRANGASIRNFGFVTVTGQARGETWRLARRTRDIWAEVAHEAGVTVLHKGLHLVFRSPEAAEVAEAFLATEMGEGCALVTPAAFRREFGGLGGSDMVGALRSPHELRVESRETLPRLAAFLHTVHGVAFHWSTAALDISPPRVRTSRGDVRAAAVIVCPGDDFATLYPDRIAAYGPRRCRLSMVRLEDPGVRLPSAVMSDLGLTRYAGYQGLEGADALRARLLAEVPRAFDNGVHLIIVQSADGSLVVGDSHHYDDLPGPFAPASAEADILDEYARALGRPAPAVLERWTGTYAVSDGQTHFVDAPDPAVRIVMVTTGAGASLCFGLAEATCAELLG